MTSELTTGLFTLLGVCLGAVVTYLFALRIAAKQAQLVAAAKLRAAFAPEIAELQLMSRNQKGVNVSRLLESTFPKHAAAIEEYRPFVCSKDQAAYQKAWEEYYCEGGSLRFYPDNVKVTVDEIADPIAQKPYIERIQGILRFAKR